MAPKVAVQLVSTGGLYGAEKVLLELAVFLREQGWESHVVALEGSGAAALVREATARALKAQAFTAQGHMPLPSLLRRLRELLAGFPQAVVHSHGYKPDLLLRWLGMPRRLACIATCHSAYSEVRKLRALEWFDRRAVRSFDRAVGVSPQICAELRAAGVPAERIALVANGIGTVAAQPAARGAVRAEFGLAADTQLLVHVGRQIYLKRIDLLLRALHGIASEQQLHLLLVGEGPLRGELEQLSEALGLSQRVHFCGYRHDVTRLLAAADGFVLNSDSEGAPVTVLEAMAVGCPIVATRVGSIPELLRDGEDAALVPPGDLAALQGALQDLLRDPARAKARAATAHRRFLGHYSRDAMGRSYLKIYEESWERRGWH
jgi:glycosyltransferase involved in cell wall biosynthesis